MYQPNLKYIALPVHETMAIEVLGGGLRTPNLGEDEAVGGSEMVPFETALVNSYRPSIVTFRLSLVFTRFRDIAVFVLQHTIFSHPTSSLPKISHVPLEVGGWSLGYKKRRCWANYPSISFQDFQPMCS